MDPAHELVPEFLKRALDRNESVIFWKPGKQMFQRISSLLPHVTESPAKSVTFQCAHEI